MIFYEVHLFPCGGVGVVGGTKNGNFSMT